MIFIASDHAGFKAKEEVKKILQSSGVSFQDLGPDSDFPTDYPVYAKKVANKVKTSPRHKGILICGSGTGMVIAANRFKGIRAAFAYDKYSAEMARKDNNANVLTLRSRNFDHKNYKMIVKTFLETKFSNLSRHKKRVELLK